MSADNWEICPNCLSKAQRTYAADLAAVMARYGSIPIEEFDAQRGSLKQPDPETFRTFREDYEIYGAESGVVKVDYSGRCSECGVGTDFKDTRPFWDSEGEL